MPTLALMPMAHADFPSCLLMPRHFVNCHADALPMPNADPGPNADANVHV